MLDRLNSQQKQAVTTPEGPTLVLAGPGSGKTRVLTHRIAYLVADRGAPLGSMQSRVRDLLAPTRPGGTRGLDLGTFHATAARMLRRHADRLPVSREFVIFDDSDQMSLVRETIKELNFDPKQVQPGRVLGAISSAKSELIDWQHFSATTYFGEIVHRVYERYQTRLQVNNGVDFDDLLLYAVQLLQTHDDVRSQYHNRYGHILVDEFQDTNTAQYALLRLLTPPSRDVFVVGDADQSIYRWRGADYRNVQRFQEDYPDAKVILLEQNYRSTQIILDAAMSVIDRLPNRHVKKLFTDRGKGTSIELHEAYDEADEAQFVIDTIAVLTHAGEAEPGECAVMYRTNAQSRALEEAFLRAGLPYRLVGAQRFYGRREVKDIVAYLRLVQNPDDRISLLRVLNTPSRGIGAKTIEALLHTADRAGVSPGQILQDLGGGNAGPYGDTLDNRATTALTDFGHLLLGWLDARQGLSLSDLIDRIIRDVSYREYIDDGSEEGTERWDNVLELQRVAEEFVEVDLAAFLEQIALVSDQDTLTDDVNAPILLTLHAAKGLEFRVVFIIGLDDGMIPHQRSFEDPEAMAEERRLLYVGITRAKDRLYLIRSFRRRIYGASAMSEPSRFLSDLPADIMSGDWLGGQTVEQASYARQTRWETPAPPRQARYRAGMRVIHPTFGEGIVMESKIDRDDEEVVVAFETGDVKHLLASLANLETASE
jgi:DNA helicase-2/ATP-dependent DNA helicase PcrA